MFFCTPFVWWPWKVPSRTTSRHHWIRVRIRVSKPNFKTVVVFVWNHKASPEAISREPKAPVRGQGLGSTM